LKVRKFLYIAKIPVQLMVTIQVMNNNILGI